MPASSSTEPDLTRSGLADDWTGFVISMYILWSGVLLLSISSLWRVLRVRRAKGAHSPGRILLKFVLYINMLVACARIAFFVDPRGWEGRYTNFATEVLLHIPRCFQLSQWLLIILRWRDLGLFADVGGLSRMIKWTPTAWTRITFTVVGVLSTLIVLFVFLAVNGVAHDTMTKGTSYLLGVFSIIFVVVGFIVGCSTAAKLFRRSWMNASHDNHLSAPGGYNSNSDTASGSSKWTRPFSNKTGSDNVDLSAPVNIAMPSERKSSVVRMGEQIVVSLALAGPLALVLVALAVWRGNQTLTAAQFFGYLVARHSIEVVLSLLVLYAASNEPTVVVTNAVNASIRFILARPSVITSEMHAVPKYHSPPPKIAQRITDVLEV
eukprot:c9407_g1_i1.p1 GENE.c9407_g1_i1~~c9407_g1_i1.p1  ORF type:complete len:379 (+),score=59.80 c9407_g1_i1:42-1178(+)